MTDRQSRFAYAHSTVHGARHSVLPAWKAAPVAKISCCVCRPFDGVTCWICKQLLNQSMAICFRCLSMSLRCASSTHGGTTNAKPLSCDIVPHGRRLLRAHACTPCVCICVLGHGCMHIMHLQSRHQQGHVPRNPFLSRAAS